MGGGQFNDILNNLIKLRDKELGILVADRTIYTNDLSVIDFTMADTYLNLKEFNIMIQHNFAQFSSSYVNQGFSFVVSGWTKEAYSGDTLTFAQFPVVSTTDKFNTLVSQIKLCGNLTVQNFMGSPTSLEPFKTMWGGWTTGGITIPNTTLNQNTTSILNQIAENRTQCTEPIKRLRFYFQDGSGRTANMPNDAYLHITIYGIQN